MAGSFAPTIDLTSTRSTRESKTGLERASGGLASIKEQAANVKGQLRISKTKASAQRHSDQRQLNVSREQAQEQDRASAFSARISEQGERKAPVLAAAADSEIALAQVEADAERTSTWDSIGKAITEGADFIPSLWDSANGENTAIKEFLQPIADLSQALLSNQITNTVASIEAHRLYIQFARTNPELAEEARKQMNNMLPFGNTEDVIQGATIDVDAIQARAVEEFMVSNGIVNIDNALELMGIEAVTKDIVTQNDLLSAQLDSGDLTVRGRQQIHDDMKHNFDIMSLAMTNEAMVTLSDTLQANGGAIDANALTGALFSFAASRRNVIENTVQEHEGQDSPFTNEWKTEQLTLLNREMEAYYAVFQQNQELLSRQMSLEQQTHLMEVVKAAPVLMSIADLPGGQGLISTLLGPNVIKRGVLDPVNNIQKILIQEFQNIVGLGQAKSEEVMEGVLDPNVPYEDLTEEGKVIAPLVGLQVLSNPEFAAGDEQQAIGTVAKTFEAFGKALINPDENLSFVAIMTSPNMIKNVEAVKTINENAFIRDVGPHIEGLFTVGLRQYISDTVGTGGASYISSLSPRILPSSRFQNLSKESDERYILSQDKYGAPQIVPNPKFEHLSSSAPSVDKKKLNQINSVISGTVRLANAAGLDGTNLAERMIEDIFRQEIDVIVTDDGNGGFTFEVDKL